MAPYKDGFHDILDERRHTSDFTFMSRARVDVPYYKHRIARTPDEIKEHVLNSDRVKYTVERVSFSIFHAVAQLYRPVYWPFSACVPMIYAAHF